MECVYVQASIDSLAPVRSPHGASSMSLDSRRLHSHRGRLRVFPSLKLMELRAHLGFRCTRKV